MTKIGKFIVGWAMVLMLSGCLDTTATDTEGNETKEFKVGETAIVNDTKITINSVSKIEKECSFEFDGKCQSYTEPDNDYFLLLDVTIENTGSEELSLSSILSFELKQANGEKADENIFLKAIKSSLDGSVMANDILKGQIAYDVSDSDYYNFYYQDSLLDDNIKFVINKSDIN